MKTRECPKRPLLSGKVWSLLSQRLQLSQKEVQILRGLLNDKPEAWIAKEMGISNHTVHTHLKRLYRKLSVTSRCAAVSRVFEEYLTVEQALALNLSGECSFGDKTPGEAAARAEPEGPHPFLIA